MAISPDMASILQNVDLKSILGGNDMGNLGGTGSDGLGGGVLLGLLLGRSGILGGAGTEAATGHAAVDAAVASALASANQANNNAMLLLKDIQDTGQGLTAAITSGNQTQLTTSLQGQIANLQGQAAVLAGIEASKGTVVNEIHESEVGISAGINSLAASTAAAFGVVNTNNANQTAAILNAISTDGMATRALIQGIETASLNRQIVIADNRITELLGDRAAVNSGINVTTTVNQAQAQSQQQQQLQVLTNAVSTLASHVQATNMNIITGNGNATRQQATAVAA